MPCPLGKCVRCNQIRKVQQKMLYKIMGYPFSSTTVESGAPERAKAPERALCRLSSHRSAPEDGTLLSRRKFPWHRGCRCLELKGYPVIASAPRLATTHLPSGSPSALQAWHRDFHPDGFVPCTAHTLI
jgi:hypothetical protein